MHPIVIVGSGMAAYAVAREFRKLNTQQELLMICADQAINYAKPTLSNALVANKAPEQIALADAAKMSAQLNMSIQTHSEVQRIDADAHKIYYLHAGEIICQPYEKLVLALGAQPILPQLTGNACANILVINHLDDYTQFRQQLAASAQKRVVILGAGLIGCEFANDLQHTGHQVQLVDLAPQALGRLLPSDIATEFQTRLESIGIEFILNTTATHVETTNTGSYTLNLTNGRCLEADVIVSAMGLIANTILAKQANIHTNRGILTNTQLETNQIDIYAVGDCAEVNGNFLPYVMPIMQQARALAKTLNGVPGFVHYPAMPVAVKTPAAPLTVLPLPANVEATWQMQTLEDGMIAQAYDNQHTLRGFVLLGATAAKQRLSLSKLVPDLIEAQA